MRILVINPMILRLQAPGADEQDWFGHIEQLQRLGHEVQVVTIQNPGLDREAQEQYYAAFNVQVAARVIPAVHHSLHAQRFRDLAYLDGAAWVYAQPDYLRGLQQMITDWQPEVVWCHGSYMWPPAKLAQRMGYKTVVRSVNYEPLHEFTEQKTLANRLRYAGKWLGERRSLRYADVYAAITPAEQALYQQIAPDRPIYLLPLRGMMRQLQAHPFPQPTDHQPLRVFMMGSTYRVTHNEAALAFFVEEIVPRVRAAMPGAFEFHVLGGKAPARYTRQAAADLHFAGFVPDLVAHLRTMDMAVIPSLFGQGMQQKVFEPLCYGFPTITHRRALAGYPLDEAVMTAETPEEYVAHLQKLRDPAVRQAKSAQSLDQAHALFNPARMDGYVQSILDALQS